MDGSSLAKKVKPGYHICEAIMLTKNEKQPVSIYSEIYSTKSKDFISTKKYTEESIDKVIEVIGKFTGRFDRGYDDNKVIMKMDNSENYFIIRMNDRRIVMKKH